MRPVCVLIGTALLAAAAADNSPHWHKNVAEAFTEARRAHKPILAVLHCPH
jgi:hypothetical protein